MTPLRRATLAEQAYQELQQQILSGRLPAGHRLFPEELAGKLAISPTPVKEALAQLERDGLVESEARHGSIVRRFTPVDIVEIYDARILIETHALGAGLRARRVTDAVIDGLQAIHDDQMAHAERRNTTDLAEAIRLDRAFHQAIVALGGNRITANWHNVILGQTQTIGAYTLARYDVTRARDEHAAIIAALRNGTGAVRALRAHLDRSREEMLSRPPEDMPPLP